MNIKGKKVILRAIEREDIHLLQKWANDEEISLMVGGWHFPTSKKDTEKWFEGLSVNSLNQRFIIQAGDGIIGTASLVDINWKDKNAFHGIIIGEKDNRGKGYAMDTVMAIMRYSFEELGLNRLDTTIIEYNQASLSLYSNKCGWKKEGVQEEWYFRQNRYWGRCMMGITRTQYNELITSNNYWDAR